MSNLYLVAYDIREPARLQRVHYRLKKLGLAIQYSVFVIEGHPLMQQVHNTLGAITAPEDDVRIYRLHSRQALWMSGRETARPSRKQPPKSASHSGPGLFARWFGRKFVE